MRKDLNALFVDERAVPEFEIEEAPQTIAAGGAAIGAAMELFMIHTGFCASLTHSPPTCVAWYPTACANLDCLVPFILPFSLVLSPFFFN
jgi:hypothetical protein